MATSSSPFGSLGRLHSGALNAGTTFFLDGTVNLFILAAILIGAFGFPVEIVFGRIIPGAAIAIFAGNALMAWDARRQSARLGREDLTAIPIGLDIATTFLMAFLVLGPVFLGARDELGVMGAAQKAWYIGMAVTLWIGVGKLVLSLLGPSVQRILPNSAILGTLAGVAITWMGAEPLLGIFEHPEVGLFALSIIIFSLMAGHRLPFNLPGAFIAVFFGTCVYLIIAGLGLSPNYVWPESKAAALTFPHLSLGGIAESFSGGIKYFGVILPLTLFSAISAVNIVRSAKLVGDDFSTRRVMVVDALATIVSALCGGVVQTVTYLGHTTYKRMGARANYGMGAAIIILLLTLLGLIEYAATYIPNAVLKGVLIVVAADILRISLGAVKTEHAPSFIFAIIPAIFAYTFAKLELLYGQMGALVTNLGGNVSTLLPADVTATYNLLGALSRGAILTALLISAIVCWIVMRQFRKAALGALLCALFTACGLIHSVVPSGEIYLPWALDADAKLVALMWSLVTAYGVLAVMLFAFSFLKQDSNAMAELTVTDGGYD